MAIALVSAWGLNELLRWSCSQAVWRNGAQNDTPQDPRSIVIVLHTPQRSVRGQYLRCGLPVKFVASTLLLAW